MLLEIRNYIDDNKNRFLDELIEFLKIPSISSIDDYAKEVLIAAEYVANRLKEAGADKVEIIPTKHNPVVYGEKIINNDAPTILVYGHYDVQPIDPIDLWETNPFDPVIKDNKIYARGADDDKGQLYMQIKAFELMNRTNKLKCNVKFFIEGDEESGKGNVDEIISNNKEKLKCDIVIASDTSIVANDIPSIDVGLRGLCYFQIRVDGPSRDLHSGVYGGAVANPINILSYIISNLFDENNKIKIPGFYNDVYELSQEERLELLKIPFDLEEYKNEIGVNDVFGEKGYNSIERSTVRPSIDVNGIYGGYTGEGAKTIIPSYASAKISIRIVPNQKPENIKDLFINYINSITPNGVRVNIEYLHGGEPYFMPLNNIGYKAISKAMYDTFNKYPIPTRSGGSIPIVTVFEKELNAKTILMGFGLETDAIHSPNEHFGIYNFLKGIETIPLFFNYYREMYK